jgi:hypothetical protein
MPSVDGHLEESKKREMAGVDMCRVCKKTSQSIPDAVPLAFMQYARQMKTPVDTRPPSVQMKRKEISWVQ